MDSATLDVSRPVVVLDPGDVGHGAARSLGRLGVPVYGVHTDPQAPGAHSKYWRKNFAWRFDDAPEEESLRWLLQLGAKLPASREKPILLPTDDVTCLFVADHADALREGFLFPEQPAGLARSLSSKQGMDELCRKHRIPTPETVFPQSREDVLHFSRDALFPVMLKCIYTFLLNDPAGPRMVLAENAGDLLDAYDRMESPKTPNFMIQEYIPGGAEAVWMFDGYFDGSSDCLFGLTGQKLRQYPAYTGRTSLGICRKNEAFAKQVCQFMKTLGYRGILDIGYKLDSRSGEYKLLDVNPRLGMSFRLFVDSIGMDVARALYLDLTGQIVRPGQAVEGRKWLVEDIDMASSVRYFRDRRLNLATWLGSFRGVREACWFARDDIGPAAARASRLFGRLFRKEHKQEVPGEQPAPAVPTAQCRPEL